MNEPNKKFTTDEALGIALTNREIKYIIKVVKSLEYRGILLKELLRIGLPLMKKLLTPPITNFCSH